MGALPENGSAPHAAPGVKWIRRGQQFALEHIKRAGRLARNLGSYEIDRFDQVLPVLPGSMTIYGSSPYSMGVRSYYFNSIQKTPAMDPLSPPLAVCRHQRGEVTLQPVKIDRFLKQMGVRRQAAA